MAIYTRFGTPVTVISWERDGHDQLWVTVRREDGSEREYAYQDLRADDGLPEIMAAINAANADAKARFLDSIADDPDAANIYDDVSPDRSRKSASEY